MSQDRLRNEVEATPRPKPDIGATIEALRSDSSRLEVVPDLSDLSRAESASLNAAWSTLAVAMREAIVREMDRLTEDRIDLAFGRALRAALDDSSPVVRQLAVSALWEDEGRDLLERFRILFQHDPSEDVQAEAARALGRFAERALTGDVDPETGETLRQALLAAAGDVVTPHSVRRRVIESLGAFGNDPDISNVIRNAYDDDDQGLQSSALYAMGQTLDAIWWDILREELTNPDAELRYEAARACGVIGDDCAVLSLVEVASDDEDAEVRHAAITALGLIGGRSSLRALQRLLADAGEADAELIEAALEEANAAADPLRAAT